MTDDRFRPALLNGLRVLLLGGASLVLLALFLGPVIRIIVH
ncbi:hypothetical protein [Winogradskya consettensis]|nr:hypothetical protein [Actinoplanes consettensis]